MKFYIATGLERGDEARALAERLKELGHEITYAWWEHGSVQTEGPERIREVAVKELDGVTEAELFIALLPGGRGTHTELGAALVCASESSYDYARNSKKVVLVGPTEQVDASGQLRTCAFYLHPQVLERLATVGELLAWLRGRQAFAP